ncbi:MAG: PLP-dependent aminotransferase family protein [Eubacteriales bacterium]|nr:PLP-dependent aminotransferase family protein [Eubacteriales bacterium]
MLNMDSDHKKTHLYMEVYQYYKDLILEKKLLPGSKMPSLRKSSQELRLSRTTIETAYLQLAADGYIIAKAQSGYYVTDTAHRAPAPKPEEHPLRPPVRYDFASSGVDRESFRFDLWSRYMKSALRQEERLLTYGEAQGEADFREALSDYVRIRRNILCSPQDIVVGASVQSLLQILCPLIVESGPFYRPLKYYVSHEGAIRTRDLCVSFPDPSFLQGITVFQDYGFQINYRSKDSDVIYVSPAHMTKWGEIMPVSRRLELLGYAKEHSSLVIEDDFENELVYLQKPTPSLYGLAGGESVVYIGSFSRLLLPSIRISFMVLPPTLARFYKKKAASYNQTASKAEQIALCQFIRDGHLAAQLRKLRRLYGSKQKELRQTILSVFGQEGELLAGDAGTRLALTLPYEGSLEALTELAREKGLRIHGKKTDSHSVTLLLSCSSIPSQDLLPACLLLKEILEQARRDVRPGSGDETP